VNGQAGAPADERADVEVPLTGLRGAVARAMEAAWQAPRVAVGFEVDMTACLARQRVLQLELGPQPRLSPTHFVIRAAALAMRDHPGLNAHIGASSITLSSAINVGLAVNVEGGVMVPVIRHADLKPIEIVAAEAADAAHKARTGALTASASRGGTFTVSTLGSTGAAWFTPILNGPQVAILGVGALGQRAVVRDGAVVAAPMMTLTLVFDHRALDGYPAAQGLAAIRGRLEEPSEL
jgi:pyruvate dehydrogenase E2 component (dihydrolipoamide acetyltransferase)